MSRLYETAAVLVLVAVVVYGLVRVVSALLDSHTGYSSRQEASSVFFLYGFVVVRYCLIASEKSHVQASNWAADGFCCQ